MYRKLSLPLAIALMAISLPAAAEEEAKKPNPANEAYQALADKLGEAEKRHFTTIYKNHNAISIVHGIQDTLSLTVEKCGEKHADLKEPMETRYEAWSEEIEALLKDAQANIDNMVAVQEYAPKGEIEKVLDLLDKTRKEQDERVKKVPVTSQEGCEFAFENMDGTQNQLAKLLKATLISLPLSMQHEMDEKKAKADTKAREDEAEGEDESAE